MKKILGFVTLTAILMATSTVWAQSAPSYNFNAVAGTATAALSRVGAVETDLAAAKTEVQALKADLATLKTSRSASAGAVWRANQALAAAQAKVAELEKQMAVAQASDEAGQKRLETLMLGKPGDWNYLLPTEDPLVGLVRQKCPEGTTPEYITFGATARFECRPFITAADLTTPADSGDSYFTSCLSWAAGGAVLGSAVNYGWGYKQDADSVGWEDAAIGAGVGGGGAYVGCLAYHAIKGK